MTEIYEKWGFGMAPEKSATITKRLEAIDSIIDLIEGRYEKVNTESILDDISCIKGLFTRIGKQDRWDWFTVFDKLGRPGIKKSFDLSQSLAFLRRQIKSGEDFCSALEKVKEMGLRRHLNNYKYYDNIRHKSSPRIGEIYILSRRSERDVLKIGYTTRSIYDRVKEINRATGILEPLGVRAIWTVDDPRQIEKMIHRQLEQYRIRKDREFFRIDYYRAFKIIYDLIKDEKIKVINLRAG